MEDKRKAGILKDRAKKLAKVLKKEQGKQMVGMIFFEIGNETYAFEAKYVLEVCNSVVITSVPCTPSFITGIVNIRGEIFSISDLCRLLDMDIYENIQTDKIILLSNETMEFGIGVDKVLAQKDIDISDIKPPPKMLPIIKKEFLKGVLFDGTVILDIKKILKDESMIVYEGDKDA